MTQCELSREHRPSTFATQDHGAVERGMGMPSSAGKRPSPTARAFGKAADVVFRPTGVETSSLRGASVDFIMVESGARPLSSRPRRSEQLLPDLASEAPAGYFAIGVPACRDWRAGFGPLVHPTAAYRESGDVRSEAGLASAYPTTSVYQGFVRPLPHRHRQR